MEKPDCTFDKDIPLHLLRAIGFFVACAIIFAGLTFSLYNPIYGYLLPVLILYPTLAIIFERRLKIPNLINLFTGFFDIIMLSFVISLTGFNLVPTCTLILIMSTNVFITIGVKAWLFSILALATGVIASIMTFGFTLSLDMHFATVATSFIGLILYFTCMSYYMNLTYRALISTQQELQHVHEERAIISKRLSKYLAPQVWGAVFSNINPEKLEPQRKKLSIFFSDIQDFTEITEELQPESLTELLNNYLTEMSIIAQRYGGTIDKFIGDAILIFYGDPTSKGSKDDAIACVSMAIEMRKKMKMLRKQWKHRGITRPLHIRMGIHSGYSTIGSFGAETRMDYTVIGKEVNLASRLESVAKQDQIYISEGTYELIKETILCRSKGTVTVKGFTKPVGVYEVTDFRKDMGASHSFVEHEREGFAMYLDITKVRSNPKEARQVVKALDAAVQTLKSKIKL